VMLGCMVPIVIVYWLVARRQGLIAT
jgi:hypothetical protein